MSRPGPARKPDNVRRLFGTDDKSKPRADLSLPGARVGSLKPPDWLSPLAAKTWREVIPKLQAEAPDWLAEVDVPVLALMLETYAMAVGASRAMRRGGGHLAIIDIDEGHGGRRRKHPAHQVFRESAASFLSMAKEFGLTPVARNGLGLALFGAGSGDDDEADDAGIFDGD